MGKIGIDEMLGAVKFEGQWHFFASDIGHWVMDAMSFTNSTSAYLSKINYRKGIFQADENNAKQFIDAMGSNELSIAEVKIEIQKKAPEFLSLKILIDFDARVFIDGYTGDNLNKYIPKNWNGYEKEPYDDLPDYLEALWD